MPISVGVKDVSVSPFIENHEPSLFFFSHWSESKFPSLFTSSTTFEVPFSLIHEPNFEAVKSKSMLGFEANPEKKLPEDATPFALKYET